MFDELIPLARTIAEDIDRDYRHVSIILRKGRVISVGTNIWKSHPQAVKFGYRFAEPHSELRALMKIPETKRDKLTLVNFRFNKRGELRLSKPCSRCEPWVKSLFKRVYYSTNEGIIKLLSS